MDNTFRKYSEMKKKMIEEHISFQSQNNFSEYEEYMMTSFWCTLTKTVYDNNDDIEPIDEILLEVEDGSIIPSIIEFAEVDSFISVLDFCDSIDGDIMETYDAIADTNNGIKEEFISELDLPEESAYESSILYIWNVKTKDIQYLDMFLSLFDDFVMQMPSRFSRIAVVLINKIQQPDYINIFKENNWKIKSISKDTGFAYRRI